MIGYVTIGANDFERAKTFYDAVLAPMGGKRTFTNGDHMQFYGAPGTTTMFAVCEPFDGQPASAGNGSMFGLPAATKEIVDAVHAAAMAAGAACEGKPGLRLPNFYGAYFRDPDGNKICVFNMS